MKRVTQQGLALQGDGIARARSRIAAAGFPNVTAFIEAAPRASLLELADQLNESDADSDPLPISAHHLAQLWRAEASNGDAQSVERFARRALVGELHRHLRSGWPHTITRETVFPIAHAQATWLGVIGHDLESRADEVFDALGKLATPGWLPASVDDPVLQAAFARWNEH